MTHPNHGTSLDSLLAEEGILKEATKIAESRIEDWQQRVLDEKARLNAKMDDLFKFIVDNPVFKTLAEEDQELMKKQLFAMQLYSNVLRDRIARFSALSSST